MIEVRCYDKEEFSKTFNTPQMALRFMYAMRNKGIMILGYSCDDPYDNQWLDRRFNL